MLLNHDENVAGKREGRFDNERKCFVFSKIIFEIQTDWCVKAHDGQHSPMNDPTILLTPITFALHKVCYKVQLETQKFFTACSVLHLTDRENCFR